MDWVAIVDETDRIEREAHLAKHTTNEKKKQRQPSVLRLPTPPPPPPPRLPRAQQPRGSDPNAKNFTAPDIGKKKTTQAPRPAGGISYAAAAKATPRTGTDNTWNTVTRGGKSSGTRPQHNKGKEQDPLQPVKGLDLDQRRFIFVRDSTLVIPYHETKLMSAVSMALHQEGVSTHIRIFQLRRNDKGTLAGLSTPFAPIGQLLHYRDIILWAARTVDPAIVNITANETWKRLKIHGVSLERYLGKVNFGLNKLRAEIESENEGIEIPMEMRWLGRVSVTGTTSMG